MHWSSPGIAAPEGCTEVAPGRLRQAALLSALFTAAAACSSGAVVVRTDPVITASSWRQPEAPIHRVAVLSSGTVKGLWTDPGEGSADEDAPARAVEQALFAVGWEPATRVVLRRLVSSGPLAVPLDTASEPSAVWVENALGLSRHVDGVVDLSAWSVRWERTPALELKGQSICAVVAELKAEVHDSGGRLVWYGRALTRSTDFGELHARMKRNRVELDEPSLACVTRGPCRSCSDEIAPDVRERMATHAANALVRRLAVGVAPGSKVTLPD